MSLLTQDEVINFLTGGVGGRSVTVYDGLTVSFLKSKSIFQKTNNSYVIFLSDNTDQISFLLLMHKWFMVAQGVLDMYLT